MICFLLGLGAFLLALSIIVAVGTCIIALTERRWPEDEEWMLAFLLGLMAVIGVPVIGLLFYQIGCYLRGLL